MKIIFGFPTHERFESALDLYKSIRKFNPGCKVVWGSNQDIGYDVKGLQRIKSKRRYAWGHIHCWLFDVFEHIQDLDFDYYVNLDSDCLFANYGFEKIFNMKFDFTVDPGKNENSKWKHSGILKSYESDYNCMLKDCNIEKKTSEIVGNLMALAVFSKKAVKFIVSKIKDIEQSKGYVALMNIPKFCLDELLVSNILLHAGFKYAYVRPVPINTIRYRPFWKKKDLYQRKSLFNWELISASELGILYHPVRRNADDSFRNIVLKLTS